MLPIQQCNRKQGPILTTGKVSWISIGLAPTFCSPACVPARRALVGLLRACPRSDGDVPAVAAFKAWCCRRFGCRRCVRKAWCRRRFACTRCVCEAFLCIPLCSCTLPWWRSWSHHQISLQERGGKEDSQYRTSVEGQAAPANIVTDEPAATQIETKTEVSELRRRGITVTRRLRHKCQGDEAGATPIDGKTAAALCRSSETMEREFSWAVIKYARRDTARDVVGTYLLPHSRGPILV
jgi:hypothetical protein